MSDRHYYTEGKQINVCVFCGGKPEHIDHMRGISSVIESEELSAARAEVAALKLEAQRVHDVEQTAGNYYEQIVALKADVERLTSMVMGLTGELRKEERDKEYNAGLVTSRDQEIEELNNEIHALKKNRALDGAE